MRRGRLALLLLLSAASGAGAIVIRDDVDDAAYRVAASELPALADLPGEGHGVLIAPQWVVTAAHAVAGRHDVGEIVVAGKARKVEPTTVRPGAYGQSGCNVRLSRYAGWIGDVTGTRKPRRQP